MPTLKIRKMQLKDSKRIWQIRNADANRIFANNPERIPFTDHQKWLQSYLTEAFLPLVLSKNDRLIGYLRFDQTGKRKAVISIAVDPKLKGQGLGSYLLKEGLKQYEKNLKKYIIIAEVKPDNIVSNKLFEKCNFQLIRKTKKHNVYRYDYPKTIIIATNHDWGIRPKNIKTKNLKPSEQSNIKPLPHQ